MRKLVLGNHTCILCKEDNAYKSFVRIFVRIFVGEMVADGLDANGLVTEGPDVSNMLFTICNIQVINTSNSRKYCQIFNDILRQIFVCACLAMKWIWCHPTVTGYSPSSKITFDNYEATNYSFTTLL